MRIVLQYQLWYLTLPLLRGKIFLGQLEVVRSSMGNNALVQAFLLQEGSAL